MSKILFGTKICQPQSSGYVRQLKGGKFCCAGKCISNFSIVVTSQRLITDENCSPELLDLVSLDSHFDILSQLPRFGFLSARLGPFLAVDDPRRLYFTRSVYDYCT